MEAKISSKNQIVIPKECREILGTSAGDTLIFIQKGNVIFMMKYPQNPSKRLKGLLKTKKLIKFKNDGRNQW